MLKVHHLNRSQSERIVWLCEELGLDYELVLHRRDSSTMMAPASLKALHPVGSAPLIEDGGTLLAESAAIVDYLIATHGNGRLKLAPIDPGYASFLYWFHFANGSLQPAIIRLYFLARLALSDDHPVKASVQDRLNRLLAFVERRLAQSDYLAGRAFTAADIMTVVSLTTMRLYSPLDLAPYSCIRAYLQRIGQRPAYQRAMAKGDPDLQPMLT